jgi:hypothetical protein
MTFHGKMLTIKSQIIHKKNHEIDKWKNVFCDD